MRKNLVFNIGAIIFLVICGLAVLKNTKPAHEQYAMTAVVVDFNWSMNEVTCMDFTGNEWVFWGIEDWEYGDIVSLLMDDNGTAEIFDDVILDTKYEGWINDSWGWDFVRREPLLIIEK